MTKIYNEYLKEARLASRRFASKTYTTQRIRNAVQELVGEGVTVIKKRTENGFDYFVDDMHVMSYQNGVAEFTADGIHLKGMPVIFGKSINQYVHAVRVFESAKAPTSTQVQEILAPALRRARECMIREAFKEVA